MTAHVRLWLNAQTMRGATSNGQGGVTTLRHRPRLIDYLLAASWAGGGGDVVVYLTGARPEPPKGGAVSDWLLDKSPGFTASGHYLDADRPVGRFVNDDTGRAVTVRRAAELFGEITDPVIARDAWELVAKAWRREWSTDLLASLPASGRIALNMCGAGDWPAVSDDTADLIRNTTPQHRIELVQADPAVRDVQMPGFAYLDARWSYVALLRALAVGEPQRLTGDAAEVFSWAQPYARARYFVTFKAPKKWDRIGTLLTKHDLGAHWHAPSKGQTWCDGAELLVARANLWHVNVHDALVWPEGQRPLDRWHARMLRVVDTLRDDTHLVGATNSAPHAAARNVVRAIILQTLGAMHAIAARNVVYAADASAVPIYARNTMTPRGDGWTYTQTMPLTRAQAAFTHPEITAQIWGRAHARILSHRGPGNVETGALHVPPHELLAIHGDALYLTRDPRWPDDGKIGRMRTKGKLAGPLPWPATMRDVYTLAKKSEATP